MNLILLFGIASVTTVNALKCYICSSDLHGSACYDPVDTSNVDYMKCEDVYRSQRLSEEPPQSKVETFDFKAPEKLQFGEPNYNTNTNWGQGQYPTAFECVQYEMIHHGSNKREFVRKCQGRSQPQNLCSVLQREAPIYRYTLGKCDVCNSDYCNSSTMIKISLFLNFLFFLVFYQCTS